MKKFKFIFAVFLMLYPAKSKSQELIDMIEESFKGIKTIEVKGNFCRVEFVEGLASSVQLDGEIRSVKLYDDIKIKYLQKDSVLQVWIDISQHPTSGQLKGLLKFSVPGNIVIKIENTSGEIIFKNIAGEIEASTISGSISGSSVLITGNCSFQANSGNIEIGHINDSKSIRYELNSISGSLEADGITANQSLSINESEIKITGNTVSGNQKYY